MTLGPSGILSPSLDLVHGSVVEGTMVGWDAGMILFSSGANTGACAVDSAGVLQLHARFPGPPTSSQGITVDSPQPSRSLDLRRGDPVPWRLLWRAGMYELYFGVKGVYYFGAAYGQGKVGDTGVLTLRGAFGNSTGLQAWTMTL